MDDYICMRCLYCGKELALLKRMTGGEFCSDAHRHKYQEEYTQLALNRLLQESQAPKETAGAKGRDTKPVVAKSAPVPASAAPAKESVALRPNPVNVVVTTLANERAITEHPEPPSLVATQAAASTAEPSAARSLAPTGDPLPGLVVPLTPVKARSYTSPRERGVEEREFTRSMPVVEIRLRPAGDPGLAFTQEPMEFQFDPQPPSQSPQPWFEPSREFPVNAMRFNELGRLELDAEEWTLPPASANATATSSPPARPEPFRLNPVRVETTPQPISTKTEPPATTPKGTVDDAGRQRRMDPPAKAPSPPVPEAVTKPMPLTLHGIAPAARKPAQVFSAPISRKAEIQAPRQSVLPLRVAMFLGPAPQTQTEAKSKATTARDEKAPQPGRASLLQEPQPAKAKLAASGVGVPPPTKEEPKRDEIRVAAAAERVERDLELPALSAAVSGSFWSRWPASARLALIAGLLAAIGGGIFLTTRGSSATRTAVGPGSAGSDVVETGPALAADAGWIQDWFTDPPRSRRARHVDVLRGSLTLRDFRLDFEGQIERQAIGWVFRANNKSFYVEKVQIVKPGLQPEVALERFAVIDGNEETRHQVSLPIEAHLDTLYKIRLEALGSHFTTWVQDQKVDEWTDPRIGAGGVGLYYESGDSAMLKDTLHIVPLTRKQ